MVSPPGLITQRRFVQIACGAIVLTFVQPVITQAQWLHQPNFQLARSQTADFSSRSGRFSAQFPQVPQIEMERDQLEGNPIQIHTFSVEGESEAFIVGYADLPAGYLKRGSKTVLRQLSQQVLKDLGLGPLLLMGKDVSLAQNPGRKFRFSQLDTTIDARFYLVGERLYLLMGAGSEARAVDQFIASFKLL